jgi:inosine/xanthosine triphosphate pyrophosphatase family protein
MSTLWLATQNPKKADELRRILPAGDTVRTLGELLGSESFDVVEDAPDFAGNARKKALACAAWISRQGQPLGASATSASSRTSTTASRRSPTV